VSASPILSRTAAWLAIAACSLGLAAAGGCSSGPEGPTDQAIRARVESVLEAFQKHARAKPEEDVRWYGPDNLREFMGLRARRFREAGFRMLADGSWEVEGTNETESVGVTLMHMGSPEGAAKALELNAEHFPDTTDLADGAPARTSTGMIALARGPFYVAIADLAEMAPSSSLVRELAEEMIKAIDETEPDRPEG